MDDLQMISFKSIKNINNPKITSKTSPSKIKPVQKTISSSPKVINFWTYVTLYHIQWVKDHTELS